MSSLPDTDAFLEALHNEVLNPKLPDPPESAIQYRPPPGTYDGAMAREVRPAMPDNMPNFAPKPQDAPGTPGTYAPILGGRGMPVMMPTSPPDDPNAYSGGSGTVKGGSPATPGNELAMYGTGTGDLPARAAPQGADIVSLLRGMFQGSL